MNPSNNTDKQNKKGLKVSYFIIVITIFLILGLIGVGFYSDFIESDGSNETEVAYENIPGFEDSVETKVVEFTLKNTEIDTTVSFNTRIPINAELELSESILNNNSQAIINEDGYKVVIQVWTKNENDAELVNEYEELLPIQNATEPLFRFQKVKDSLYTYTSILNTEESCFSNTTEIEPTCGYHFIDVGFSAYVSVTCRSESEEFLRICDDIVEEMLMGADDSL